MKEDSGDERSSSNNLTLSSLFFSQLGVSYVDLYLIHAPVFVKDPLDVWRKMEALVEQGFTRSVSLRLAFLLVVSDSSEG